MPRTLLVVALLVLVAGCDSSPAPKPAPSVVLTLDGKPVAGVLVSLIAPDGKPTASGTTAADGAAVVRSGDGSPPAAGPYKVVVTDPGEAEENPMEPAKKAARSRTPAVYSKAASTPATVTLDGSAGSFPIELKVK